MPLSYANLDDSTRKEMIIELDDDIRGASIYLSPRLNVAGQHRWAALLLEAIRDHDDGWLAGRLRSESLMQAEETSSRNGKPYRKAVPANAPETLAQAEFNRLYVRGVCRRALAAGRKSVVVYRARESEIPRPDSESMVGINLDSQALLDDLRQSKGKAPSLLPQVNSGLSVRLS